MVDFVRVVARGPRNRPGVVGRLLTTPAFVAANPDVVGAWFVRSDHARPLAALTQLSAIVGHHTSPRLKQIACPTLILSGDQDRLVPVENAYALARLIPNAKLVILRGAGHVFPLEQEEQTARALMEHFLPPFRGDKNRPQRRRDRVEGPRRPATQRALGLPLHAANPCAKY